MNSGKNPELQPIDVVMFCPQFYPMIGGSERQAARLATALAAAGCTVRILTPRVESESPDAESVDGVVVERLAFTDLSRRYQIPGIAVLNIPIILWQLGRAVRARLRGATVLHCHLASLQTAAAALAARATGVKVLCKAGVADRRSDLGEIEATGVTGPFVAWLTRRAVETWVATTEAVRAGLLRAGVEPNRIVCIPNGVSLGDDPGLRPARGRVRRFLYLGRLCRNSDRDLPTLIDAFQRLALLHDDVELALVGGGELLDVTRTLAASYKTRGRMYLPGFDDPGKWLSWAHGFVLPSRREGLSNALLEAMSVGLPCIANDIPPNREVLADGSAGILVPVGDVDALFNAMRALVEQDELALTYATRARDRVVERYSIASVAQQYIYLYQELSSQTPA